MYQEFTSRNNGYISSDLQSHIEDTTLLIAGCGVGSVAAEIALRTGFKKFILVDGDTVGVSNLNRQIYHVGDIGKNKAEALKDRLLSIYPDAEIEVHGYWLNESNASEIIKKADLIFDTIDFLDLKAILTLHEQANLDFKPVISSFSCAWGAFSSVFMPGCMTLKEFIGYDANTDKNINIIDVFQKMIRRYKHQLPTEFMRITGDVFSKMQNGMMCPAPQLSVGANCTASVMVTQAIRILDNQKIKIAPEISILNLQEAIA